MARTDSLTNYLTDVATAIKTKKGDETPIKASEFDVEIANLPSGGGGDITKYFETTITKNNAKYFFIGNIFKQIPENFKIETTDLSYLFYNYKGTHIPTLDTSNVVNMSDMFYGCENIEEIPTLNTTNVTNMSNIFRGCVKLKSIPQLDTSKVTLMSYAFYGCSLIEEIPPMDFSKVSSMTYIFDGCKKVTTIPELDLSSVTAINGAFSGMSSLVNFGGAKNLGKSYRTTMAANYSSYKLTLSSATNLSEQSLINVLNGLYDIASLGVKTQQCVLGSTNLAKLTSAEGQQALARATEKGWTVS